MPTTFQSRQKNENTKAHETCDSIKSILTIPILPIEILLISPVSRKPPISHLALLNSCHRESSAIGPILGNEDDILPNSHSLFSTHELFNGLPDFLLTYLFHRSPPMGTSRELLHSHQFPFHAAGTHTKSPIPNHLTFEAPFQTHRIHKRDSLRTKFPEVSLFTREHTTACVFCLQSGADRVFISVD